MTERDPAYGGVPEQLEPVAPTRDAFRREPRDWGSVPATAILLFTLLVIAWGAWQFVRSLSEDHGRQFPESVTKVDRSCHRDFCVQALPGRLVRVTDRDGTVVDVVTFP